MGCSSCNKEKFRDVESESENVVKKGIGMIQSYASALASRGLKNKKVSKTTKQLRVLSCFGNEVVGGEVPPCQHLTKSKITLGKHYCGGCGCGDRKATWLIAQGDEYSKLDHPKLSCPLNMPGFSDYKPSVPDEANPPITRKYYIENLDKEKLDEIPVTIIESK